MLALGCDHGGFELKQEIIGYLEEHKIPYKDFGCDSNKSVDYPVYARKVGKAIQSGECDKGILICGTGIGISIAANKMKGIRAALCTDCHQTAQQCQCTGSWRPRGRTGAGCKDCGYLFEYRVFR